jgi:hypothetical protein
VHLDERRLIELLQQPALVEKKAQALGKGLGLGGAACGHVGGADAQGPVHGHEFLHGQVDVGRGVGDAVHETEAALTQHVAHFVLAQHRAHRQRSGRLQTTGWTFGAHQS